MNDDHHHSADYDDNVSRAFELVRSAPTPDLWDRIETAPEDRTVRALSSTGWQQRRVFLAVAAALLVFAGSAVALGAMRRGEDVEAIAGSTTIPGSATAPEEETSTTLEARTSAPEPASTLLDGATWVSIDIGEGALVTDVGQSYPVGETSLGGRIVDRLADGTVIVATLNGVVSFEPGSSEAVTVWPEAATELRRQSDGHLVAMTDAGVVDLQTSELVDGPPAEQRQRIDGANGLSAEVQTGEYTIDVDGHAVNVVTPDALLLLVDGEQSDVWPLGGPVEYRVVLDDFNGRYVLAHREPYEPALPPAEHVVIDVFDGSVDSFVAIPGTVALAVADTDERPSSLATGDVALCPTMTPTVQMSAPSDLNDAATVAFDEAALAVSRCDETWLRRVFLGARWDGAIWDQLAASLRAVPDRNEVGWSFGDGTSVTVSIASDGELGIDQTEASFELRITKFDGSVVLAGSVGPETATGLLAAANHQADSGEVWDFGLSLDGGEMGDPLRWAVEEMIGTGFGRSLTVELLVTPTLVRVVSQDSYVTDGELVRPLLEQSGVTVEAQLGSVEPTDAERSTIEALQAFAAGGSLDPSIAWAEEVTLGAGPNEGKRLTPGVLADRSNWLIENAPNFRGSGEEQFTALVVVPDPTMSGGPHNHCASPPVPAPQSLAGLRRVSIQPEPSTFDSCLQWRTMDVFFDNQSRVAGITVDWWEP